ncbi:hypothetical protein C1H76_4916 [Elsinoe australis]|uniref:PRISE-like Rossmann-fold domain-containing protein n=1 Tax=Elsinoe australis TaxID=40998 RepID=A0A4U7B0N7_9PEZI|nr:hypothetical protein C1H76_4916 [Elsinoe australis]
MVYPVPTKVALVTGVNGISGNAIVEHLIRLPKTEWSKIIISSRSPLKNYWQDPRVEFLALDFLKPVDELVPQMQGSCSNVTHAFFCSYVHSDDFKKLRGLNVPLFTNFLTALDTVAKDSLQRVCLQTGGKHYGVHLGPIEAPVHEGMPRYEDHGENFYYPQEDFMFDLASKRSWKWNVIRPHAIIGFTPGANGMNEALTAALYLLCCRETGEMPKFPGNKFFYNSADDQSYAPSIADMSVWASVNEHTANEAFTHVNGDVYVWRYFWPKLAAYYGIKAYVLEWNEQGEDAKLANNFKMGDWAQGKQEVWDEVVKKYGGNPMAFEWGTWGFFDWAIGKSWSTVGTASKARKMGWTRYDDTYDTWVETFQMFENAGTLPSRSTLGVKDVPYPEKLPNPAEAAEALKRVDSKQV